MPASKVAIGHRGARKLWPENSLDGFRRTRELGVDGVEFDVHVARDGELVVIHDPTLERTTEGTGAVAERTAAELAATPLRGMGGGGAGGAGVPTLDQVLDVFAGTAIELHIEIKTSAGGRLYDGLERRLVELIARRGLQDRAILTCFVPKALETVRRLASRQRVLASVDRRAAEEGGGLAATLDRLVAIDSCLVAVEKDLVAQARRPSTRSSTKMKSRVSCPVPVMVSGCPASASEMKFGMTLRYRPGTSPGP